MWKRYYPLSKVGPSEVPGSGPEMESGGWIEATLWSTADSHFLNFYYLPYLGREKNARNSQAQEKKHIPGLQWLTLVLHQIATNVY